ncbi:hypothetical protein H920_02455 [Fukomys damarensis]|uniref:Uncharacterized protein n=1 Tax=Fukomys damarensis TaxID=885580 RepID=A0A091EKJ8_FUKDA|nr:hypothetical protein H920_02455 [Fukomys damarensis]
MVFLMQTRLFSSEEELGTSLSLGMAAAFIRGALIFTMTITSRLRCGSLSLVAQTLHFTSIGFWLPPRAFGPSIPTSMRHRRGLQATSWTRGGRCLGL